MMRENKIEYLFVGLIIAITGFEILYRASIYIEIGILIFIAFYFFRKNIKFNPDFILILITITLPVIFQAFKFNLYHLALNNIIASVVQLLICYMVLEIVKDRFHITFVNFIYFLALFSFIFYPTQFFPSIQESIKTTLGSIITPLGTGNFPEGYRSKSLIFFTYMHNYGQDIVAGFVPRNCGAFWEPGMFAVFLNLALLINIYLNNDKIFSKKNIVFIIAIITTLSTSGYIILFLIILSSYLIIKDKSKILLSFPIILAFIYVSYNYIWTLDFMSGKIQSNIENSSESSSSRFGAVLYHFKQLKEFPLGGVALRVGEEEKNVIFTERQDSPNGLSLVFFLYGIPIGILYFVLFYKGIKRWLLYNGINKTILHFFFFLVFILSAFSQDITGRLFYTMFLFFVICFPKYPIQGETIAPENN